MWPIKFEVSTTWIKFEVSTTFGASKQVDFRSASDAGGQKILEDILYHEGCRYQVGMLWADDRSSFRNIYFSGLQLK